MENFQGSFLPFFYINTEICISNQKCVTLGEHPQK